MFRFGFGTADSGVADEEIEIFFFRLQVFEEGGKVFFLGDIAWTDGDDLAAVVGMFFGRILEHFLSSSGNVDFGSVCCECLGGHEAYACSSACDEADVVGDGEEAVGVEVVGFCHLEMQVACGWIVESVCRNRESERREYVVNVLEISPRWKRPKVGRVQYLALIRKCALSN